VNGATWAHPLQEAGDKSKAIAAARSMIVGDMFDFEGAVTMAVKGLEESRAGQRHIIIISDGDPAPPTAETLRRAVDAKITITTIMVSGHGTQQDYVNMKYTAETTGGRFYEVTNPKNLPKIFTKEASVVSRSLIVEGDFRPSTASSTSGPLRGFTGVPPVSGYILTVPREGLSQTQITNKTSEGVDPIYAWWNHGLGRSIAFTPDVGVRWTSGWRSWGEFRAFWEQSIRWLLRPVVPSNATVRARVEGETAIVELEATDGKGGFATNLDPEAASVGPDGGVKALTVVQTGPGRWRTEFPASEAGSYLVNFSLGKSDDGRRSSVQASVSVPYPKEFRTVRDNAALLTQIAEKTGGRVLRLGQSQGIDAFDRMNLPIPESQRRMWDLMAIVAAVLFLLDVAVRRLAIDWQGARKEVRDAMAVREAGDRSMAAWKKAREQRGAREAPAAQSEALRKTLEQGPVLDVRSETADGGEANAAKQRAQQQAAAAEPAPGEPEDTTSRLLRAKKRASGGGSDGGDGGR